MEHPSSLKSPQGEDPRSAELSGFTSVSNMSVYLVPFLAYSTGFSGREFLLAGALYYAQRWQVIDRARAQVAHLRDLRKHLT